MDTIKNRRNAMGLTAAELARALGMARVTNLYRLETGRRAPTKQHEAALRALEYLHSLGLLRDFMTHLLGRQDRPF